MMNLKVPANFVCLPLKYFIQGEYEDFLKVIGSKNLDSNSLATESNWKLAVHLYNNVNSQPAIS